MASEASSSRRGQLIFILGSVVLVAVVAVVIVLATGGGSDSSVELSENGPITVTGDLLPAFEGDTATDTGAGLTAPILEGESFDGTAVVVEPGSSTLLVFLAHWCPHCQAEVPDLVEWAESLSVPQGLNVVGVATASAADRPNYPPSDWLLRERWPFRVIADDEAATAAQAFGTTGYPYLVMLDEAGIVQWRHSGQLADGQLEQYLDVALNQ
ncbi:MAG: TlpA family protein disulfide reductase [Ilumatobacteraceae bacterium]|nr:TlpA family protein disulfide reductase [Ilumatobacteraceae bacterium]